MDETSFLSIGKIVGSHGIAGSIKVSSNSGDLSDFSSGMRISVAYSDGRREAHTIKGCKAHNNRHFIVTLEGINDRNQADTLRGCEIFAQRTDLLALDVDTYFWEDIIGLTVTTEDRQVIGRVKTIMGTGSNDVYVVEDPETGEETLLPAIQSVIKHIDIKAGLMQVVVPDVL
jgi:16S rRNA processing protein RimM